MTFYLKPGAKGIAQFCFRSLALAAALSFSVSAGADQREQQESQPHHIYFISAVLQLRSDSNIIKPVHSIQDAHSEAEAEQSFLTLISQDFPDYTVLTTLTSPASGIRLPACERRSFAVSI